MSDNSTAEFLQALFGAPKETAKPMSEIDLARTAYNQARQAHEKLAPLAALAKHALDGAKRSLEWKIYWASKWRGHVVEVKSGEKFVVERYEIEDDGERFWGHTITNKGVKARQQETGISAAGIVRDLGVYNASKRYWSKVTTDVTTEHRGID